MRKSWFAAWAAAGITAGCAGPSKPVNSAGLAATAGPAAEEASWTGKFTAPFKTNPFTKNPFTAIRDWTSTKKPKVELASEPFDPEKATPELYVGLAQMSHRGGNVPQARQFYQKALAKDPKNLDALLGAARMEDREGQLDVALMLYNRAVAAHPRSAPAHNDLALCLARRGNLVAAHKELEQAVQIDPAKPLYRNNVAKVLVELNSLDPAMRHLAATHAPAVANYNMAVLLSERGRGQESERFLKQALAIDPQLEPARTMFAQYAAPPVRAADVGPQGVAPATAPVASAPMAPNDSILPTPEAVATVPWMPTGSSSPAGSTIAPVQLPAPGVQMPSLLPPTR